MTPDKLHLDNEFRDRWEEYETPTTVYDSRNINWRNVPWDEVTEIRMFIKNNTYTVTNTDPKFKAFMRFRWGGHVAQFDNEGKVLPPKKINTWCIGFASENTCYMKEIDFKTGALICDIEYPLSMFKAHIHPKVHNRIGGLA